MTCGIYAIKTLTYDREKTLRPNNIKIYSQTEKAQDVRMLIVTKSYYTCSGILIKISA